MSQINQLGILIFLLTLFISCKKEKNEKVEKPVVQSEKSEKEEAREFLYKAAINSVNGLTVRKEPNVTSEKLGTFIYKDSIEVLEFTHEFTQISLGNDKKASGQWVKVNYTLPNTETKIKGYVFDDFINYNAKDAYPSSKEKDTIIVHNEKEFLDALSSNRVLLIKADTLNFEKYSKENLIEVENIVIQEIDDANTRDEHYFYSGRTPSLLLNDLENIELLGYDRQVQFVVNKADSKVLIFNNCRSVTIDNINFYHLVEENVCEGEVIQYRDCSGFRILNSRFNGSGTIGCKIEKSDAFYFLNCEFFNNSTSAVHLDASTDITIKKCEFFENDVSNSLIEIRTILEGENSISVYDSHFTNNDFYSFISIEDSDVLQFSDANSIFLKNCKVYDNTVKGNFIVTSKYCEIDIHESTIFNNAAANKDCFLYIQEPDSEAIPYINFSNSEVKNNQDFFMFSNNVGYEYNYEIHDENKYISVLDSIVKNSDLEMFDTSENLKNLADKLDIDKQSKGVSYKSYPLDGYYTILISYTDRPRSLFNIDLHPVFSGNDLKAYGKLVNGLPQGKWRLENVDWPNQNLQFSFIDGDLHGSYIVNYEIPPSKEENVKEIGKYKEGKKEGLWKQYFLNNKISSEVHYESGVENGEAKYYYRNGVLSSKITYTNGQIESWAFFDRNAKPLSTVSYPFCKARSEQNNIYQFTYETKSQEHKNTVHLWYSSDGKNELLGYAFFEDGKREGIQNTSMIDRGFKRDTLRYSRGTKREIKIYGGGYLEELR